MKNDLDRITELLRSNKYKETQETILALKEKNDKEGNSHWDVKSNYFLGYTYLKEEKYGKAVVHYLEAIRHAEKGVDDFSTDLVSLYNRVAIIYKQFSAFDLAHEYYSKGIALAELISDNRQLVLLKYNKAGLLAEQGQFDEAVSLLEANISQAIEQSYYVSKYYNRLALTYYRAEDFDIALNYFDLYAGTIKGENFEKHGYAFHNKGLVYFAMGDLPTARDFFERAIESKKKHDDESILFSSYFSLGELNEKQNNIEEAISYYSMAIDLLETTEKSIDDIQVLKNQANLLFSINEYVEAKKLEDLYSLKLRNFVDVQREVEQTDKMYNMDLITKRYFDEVDKQERIASIMFFSKLTSGTLLSLLLVIIGYTQYDRIRIRRSIERELASLHVLD